MRHSDRFIAALFAISLLVEGVLLLLVSRFPVGEAPLVLHFRAGGGIDLLGGRRSLWTIPAVGAFTLIVNGFFVLFLRRRDTVLAALCAIVTLCVEIFLGLALMTLLAVNRA